MTAQNKRTLLEVTGYCTYPKASWSGTLWGMMAVMWLCACGASAPRYATLEDLNRESCLQSIKPGESMETELVAALRGCKSVTNISAPFPVPLTKTTVHSWKLSQGRSGSGEATAGVVLAKMFDTGQGMPVGDILTTYGKPDYVQRAELGGGGQCIAFIRLFYLERGLAYEVSKDYTCGEDILADARLSSTGYAQFVTGTIDEVLRGIYHQSDSDIARVRAELRPWTGFESMKRFRPR